MPTNKSITTMFEPDANPGPAVPGDTVATAATEATTMAALANVPDTAARRAVWAALAAHPGSTVAQLAQAAKISQSAAFKALTALEKAGHASRHLGGLAGAKIAPDRWQAGQLTVTEPTVDEPVSPPAAPVEHVDVSAEAHHDEPQQSATGDLTPGAEDGVAGREATAQRVVTVEGQVRLGAGKLRDLVLDHLRDHAEQEFTPFVLGKALGRSSGAIANACDRLVADGVVTRSSDKPRRYRWARAND